MHNLRALKVFFYELPEVERGVQLKHNQLQHFSAWQLSVENVFNLFLKGNNFNRLISYSLRGGG